MLLLVLVLEQDDVTVLYWVPHPAWQVVEQGKSTVLVLVTGHLLFTQGIVVMLRTIQSGTMQNPVYGGHALGTTDVVCV